jgi:hypothetical protein
MSSPFSKRDALNLRANNPMPGPFAKLANPGPTLRYDASTHGFPRKSHATNPSPPPADDGPNDKPPPPKPDFPQSGKSRRTRGFGIPANAAEQTGRLRPHGLLRSLTTVATFPATIGSPDKPRTSASPLMPRRQRPSASQPAPVTSGHDSPPRNHRKPGRTSGLRQPRQQPVSGLTSRSHHSRPWQHFPQPMKSGHISGIRHPRQRTVSGPTSRSHHSRPWRHFRKPMNPGHISGIRHPRQRTVSGPTSRSHHSRPWRYFR